jgi:hypothetical protein
MTNSTPRISFVDTNKKIKLSRIKTEKEKVVKMTQVNGNALLPVPLSAKFTDSFAYPTMRDRVPVIICKVIDLLHRDRIALNLKDPEQFKKVLEKMSKLRYEMQTNKPIKPIEDCGNDADTWNLFLQRLQDENGGIQPTWFGTRWLSAECFVYRRLLEAMRSSSELSEFDFFAKQKREAFYGSIQAVTTLLNTRDSWSDNNDGQMLKCKLVKLLKISLWGNKCDLSISAGSAQTFHQDPLTQIETLQSNLLIDDSDKIVDFLLETKVDNKILDIVMDNAGFELMSDLCLADYLISTKTVNKVRFRVKNQPWFVSDTMPNDINWLFDEMAQGASNDLSSSEKKPILVKYGEKWQKYLDTKVWTVHPDPFWTWPHDYSLLKEDCPSLYQDLEQASLVIFKGDLNYRKLVGDLKWKPTETFTAALQGFHPAPLVALRTLKADVVTGLTDGQVESTHDLDSNWMVNGEWGIIQFCNKIVSL